MNFDLDTYLNELRPLINVDCGSLTKDGIKQVANIMAEKYDELGWTIKEVDLGEPGIALEIRNKPEAEHIDVMLLGHLDTVFPVGTVAERPMSVKGDRAYGPGVADMKSGLLNIVYALRGVDKSVTDKLSICVCMNPDEEIGSRYSNTWIKSVAANAKQVLVAEAARADGSLVKARKGTARYEIDFTGIAAHSGNDPEKGRSAVSEMARWIIAIDGMTNFESGTTFNVGVVSGGTSANAVPGHAKMTLDIRFWDNDEYTEASHKLAAMLEKPFIDGVTVVSKRVAYKPSMMPSETTEDLINLVEEAGKEVGVEVKWMSAGGNSDANLTAAMGIPSLDGFGPIGGSFHNAAEYLELDSIEPRIKLLQKVLTKLAQ